VQSYKYRFLKINSIASVESYQKSIIGDDLISPPIRTFTDKPGVFLGMQRTLLHGSENVVCVFATIDFAAKCPVRSPFLRQLQMPFRIPEGLVDETAKQTAALGQLSGMTELNGFEESFDFGERRDIVSAKVQIPQCG
jgi:hypothetical protein